MSNQHKYHSLSMIKVTNLPALHRQLQKWKDLVFYWFTPSTSSLKEFINRSFCQTPIFHMTFCIVFIIGAFNCNYKSFLLAAFTNCLDHCFSRPDHFIYCKICFYALTTCINIAYRFLK